MLIKKTLLSLTSVFALLLSCTERTLISQNKNTEASSRGKIVKTFNGIRQINIAGISEVEFIKNDQNYLEIIGNDKDLSDILIKKASEKISITFDNESRKPDNISMKIFCKNMQEINVASIGSLKIPKGINSLYGKFIFKSIGTANIFIAADSASCDFTAIDNFILKGYTKYGEMNFTSIARLSISDFNIGTAKIVTTAVSLIN